MTVLRCSHTGSFYKIKRTIRLLIYFYEEFHSCKFVHARQARQLLSRTVLGNAVTNCAFSTGRDSAFLRQLESNVMMRICLFVAIFFLKIRQRKKYPEVILSHTAMTAGASNDLRMWELNSLVSG